MCLPVILPNDNGWGKGHNRENYSKTSISLATATGPDLGTCLKGAPPEVVTNFLIKPGNK